LDVYVINLDRSPERLAHMTAMLGGLDVAFQRVPAVDGRKLSEAEVKRLAPDGGLFAGEIGCFLSHRECWRRIAAGASSSGIVLEDDVIASPWLADLTKHASWIPADADLIKLETRGDQRTIVSRKTLKAGGRELARFHGANLCAAAYLVSRAAAARLFAATETLEMPVDNFMFHPHSRMFAELVTYQLIPAACIQEQFLRPAETLQFGSTIDTDRQRRAMPPLRKLAREIVRPLRQASEALSVVGLGRRRIEIPFS
jgi:glycosyl transferase family 25